MCVPRYPGLCAKNKSLQIVHLINTTVNTVINPTPTHCDPAIPSKCTHGRYQIVPAPSQCLPRFPSLLLLQSAYDTRVPHAFPHLQTAVQKQRARRISVVRVSTTAKIAIVRIRLRVRAAKRAPTVRCRGAPDPSLQHPSSLSGRHLEHACFVMQVLFSDTRHKAPGWSTREGTGCAPRHQDTKTYIHMR
ncbi:hypothetical protein L207DRAFT_117741 [Hyaloscypha variabilis F]|uniref:Uncharacterized protein n=1 Tax=Hyaloscypha variabilis (strain UAMH 11265 / GT02V1 / F) TaxID=1149755 RepID=A0A2J6RAL5_HYAVF|nr:hypothetical protein L207DRAFT_117741 [Hyaloscypha variabilis F]